MALFTMEEAAREAKTSVRTLRRLIQAGRLHALDYGTGGQRHDWRITPEALAAVAPAPSSAMPPAPSVRRRHRRQEPVPGEFRIWP